MSLKSKDIANSEYLKIVKFQLCKKAFSHLNNTYPTRLAHYLKKIGYAKKLSEASDIAKSIDSLTTKYIESKFKFAGFYLVEDTDKKKRKIIDISDLLLSFDKESRILASKLLDTQKRDEQWFLNTTLKTIDKNLENVRSEIESVWSESALVIIEALKTDFLFILKSFLQSEEIEYHEGRDKYGELVYQPSLKILNRLPLFSKLPSESSTELEQELKKIVNNSDSINDALDKYIEKLGFVPFNKQLALSTLLSLWKEKDSSLKGSKLLETLFIWSNNSQTIFSDFHLLEAIVNTQELLTVADQSTLWKQIDSLCLLNDKDSNCDEWQNLTYLARHFIYHIEGLDPSLPGEGVSLVAWWISMQLAKTIGGARISSKDFKENCALPLLKESQNLRNIVSSEGLPSSLRCGTLNMDSIWQLATLSIIVKKFDQIGYANKNNEVKEKFSELVKTTLLSQFPFKGSPDYSAYNFFRDQIEWAEIISESEKISNDSTNVDIKSHIRDFQEILSLETFVKNIAKIDTYDNYKLFHYLFNLNLLCSQHINPQEILKPFAENDNFWIKTLPTISTDMSGTVTKTFLEVSNRIPNDIKQMILRGYMTALSHSPDVDRKQRLFESLVLLSINSEVYDILDYTLANSSLTKDISTHELSDILESYIPLMRPWATSKIRRCLATVDLLN